MQNLGRALTALRPTPDAVLRIGALLIVKVDNVVAVHQLTAAQQLTLDHQPHLLTSPHDMTAHIPIRSAPLLTTAHPPSPRHLQADPHRRPSRVELSDRGCRTRQTQGLDGRHRPSLADGLEAGVEVSHDYAYLCVSCRPPDSSATTHPRWLAIALRTAPYHQVHTEDFLVHSRSLEVNRRRCYL